MTARSAFDSRLSPGQLDQCAGILFNLKDNGDYLTVRFNGMEDNVVLWTFNQGVRKFVKRGAGECSAGQESMAHAADFSSRHQFAGVAERQTSARLHFG